VTQQPWTSAGGAKRVGLFGGNWDKEPTISSCRPEIGLLNWLYFCIDGFICRYDNHTAHEPWFTILVSRSDELAVH